MKVKVLSRNTADHVRKTKDDIHPMQVNLDPKLHPLEAPREYQRALNAVKLQRVFAKPFVGALDGHTDGVFCLAKHTTKLGTIVSGACDGEVRVWSLTNKKCTSASTFHKGYVRGICVVPSGDQFITVGDDKTIRIAKFEHLEHTADTEEREDPLTIVGKNFFSGVDHHRRQDLFATSGPSVQLWSQSRSEPLQSFTWGADTVMTVKFNPVEVNILASAADDRNIALYDIRADTPIRKVTLAMRTNALCWNPMEAFNFTVANEDHNLYSFDMRRLDKALNVHKDHTSAVMSVDYSPTGREFVSGSYDRTLRIFEMNNGHSREVYHTKRMQRIFSVLWSLDSKYIMSGSDETNIRLWKTKAWESLATKASRQKTAVEYNEKLADRFKHHPEIRRIAKHRHVPKEILKAQQEKRTIERSQKRKQENRRRHSRPGAVPYTKERKKAIVKEE